MATYEKNPLMASPR